jgi:pilus assembly protein CpaB
MNKRFVGVLIFASVVSLGFSTVFYRLLVRQSETTKAAATTVRLVLAARDLELGSILRDDDVKLADWPGAVPAGATAHPQDVVGRGVTTTIYAKEPVIDSRLAPKGAGGGLAAMIPQGMRAVAVRVNEVVGVSGFVVSGMRVDVLISGNTPGSNGNLGTVTKTLLQNIEVLSAGQDFKKDAEGKPIMVQVVNLLVTPEQAEQLSLASNQTTIQLILRNPLDRQVTQTPGAAMAHLFTGNKFRMPQPGDNEPAARPRPAPKPVAAATNEPPKKETPFVMELLSGTKRAEAKFENGGGGK